MEEMSCLMILTIPNLKILNLKIPNLKDRHQHGLPC